MTDLDKARVWAECTAGLAYLKSEEIQAAVDVIQSLPDQWADAKRLRQIIDFQGSSISDEARKDLETLLAPKSSINPEDVPANEPWLIEDDGRKAIGTRYKGDTRAPWAVAALDGVLTDHSNDSDITLIHKLVPETHTLPKGMRLADHEEYGRVVVSPKPDVGNDYRVFYSYDNAETGAAWRYAHKSELTFLDGDQHA